MGEVLAPQVRDTGRGTVTYRGARLAKDGTNHQACTLFSIDSCMDEGQKSHTYEQCMCVQ